MQSHQELLRDVLTGLYRDQIFPSLSVIRERLRQMSQADEACKDSKIAVPGLKELLDVAREKPEQFKVEEDPEVSSEENKQSGSCQLGMASAKRSIQLATVPSWFEGWIDESDDADPYPSTLWAAFERYLENLARLVRNSTPVGSAGSGGGQDEDDMADSAPRGEVPSHAFRGGCYSMAVELEQRRLPFLQGRKLGEIYHIVLLALQKQLLVYQDDLLVPAAVHSVGRNAVASLPGASRRSTTQQFGSAQVVQTHGELCEVIQKVLLECPEGLDLSMLKVKILETQNVRLNENVFGCAKLLELVRLPALLSICAVERLPGRSAYRIVQRGASRSSHLDNPISSMPAPGLAAMPAPAGPPAPPGARSPPPPPLPAPQISPWGAPPMPTQSPNPPMPPRKPMLLSTAPVAPSWPNQSAFGVAPQHERSDSIWQQHDARANYAQRHSSAQAAKHHSMLGMYGTAARGCVDVDLTEGAPWRGNPHQISPTPPQSSAAPWGHYPPHWTEAGPGFATMRDASSYDMRSMGLMEASGFKLEDAGFTQNQPQPPAKLLLGTEPAPAGQSEEPALPRLLGNGSILAGILAGSGRGAGNEEHGKTEAKWIDDVCTKASSKDTTSLKTTNPLLVSHSLPIMEGEPAYIPLREVCV